MNAIEEVAKLPRPQQEKIVESSTGLAKRFCGLSLRGLGAPQRLSEDNRATMLGLHNIFHERDEIFIIVLDDQWQTGLT